MKNKFKVLLILSILTTLLFTACSSNNPEPKKQEEVKPEQTEQKSDEKNQENKEETSLQDKKITISFRDGIPALTLARMMSESKEDDSINYDMVASPDVLTSKVLNKEADFAIVPSNFAAIAYNKGVGYKIVGTGVWGNAYILTNDENINTIQDIKGKTVTLFGKGLTPDLMTKFVLKSNDIDLEKDITLEYLSAPTEIAPTFLANKANIVLAPEPMATAILLKNEKAKRLVSLNEEVKKFGLENGYPQATLIVKEELIESNKALVDEIIDKYIHSIKWATQNKEGLATLAEEKELGIQKPSVIKGFDNMNIGDFEIRDKTDYNKYFEVLHAENPQSVGGKVPDENAYYER